MSFHSARAVSLVSLALASTACTSTPLPAVITEDSHTIDASSGNTGGGGGDTQDAGSTADAADPNDAAACSALGEGRFALRSRSNGLCLGQGPAIMVLGTRGFATVFATDCRLPAESWDLVASDTAGVFSIRNVLSGYVLDVRTGDTADATPVITYPSSGRDNQRFDVRARDAYGYELRPRHATGSCVTASATSAEIDACQPSLPVQEWLLQRSDCL